ncbi:MAG: hypothetical protein R3A52_31065 [Polyangiales bacterium]
MWVAAALSAPAVALAQPAPAPDAGPTPEATRAAAAAYDSGTRAFNSGDYPAAADFFETADRTLPSAQAAIQAIRAHRGARTPSHDARAATLAQRLLSRYPTDTRVTGYAYRVIDELSPSVGRLQVRCGGCDLAVDEQTSEPDVYLPPGRHRVRAAWGERVATRFVDLAGGGNEVLTLEAPLTEIPLPPDPRDSSNGEAPRFLVPDATTGRPTEAETELPPAMRPRPPAPVARPAPSGLPPAVFITGMIVTAGLGAALTWSALDTLDGRDAYEMNPTQAGLDDGRSRELRTNVLIGATAAAGVATLVVGAFFTRWRGAAPPRVEAAVGPGSVALRGSF